MPNQKSPGRSPYFDGCKHRDASIFAHVGIPIVVGECCCGGRGFKFTFCCHYDALAVDVVRPQEPMM